MRKTLIVLAALLIAGVAGMGITHIIVSGNSSNVTFKEEVIAGDSAALDGLTFKLNTHLDEQAEWHSTLKFSDGQPAISTSVQVPAKSEGISFRARQEIKISMEDPSMGTINGKRVMPPEALARYDAILRELEESSVPGQTTERSVAVKELYEYYPLAFVISLPDRVIGSSFSFSTDYKAGSLEEYALRRLEEYFRIPVLEDEYMVIGYTTPNPGAENNRIEITHTEVTAEEEREDYYHLSNYRNSVSSDDAIYFWFSNKTGNGNRADMSMIEGGYGIYELPYGYVDDPSYLDNTGFKGYDVFVDRLSNFCPVDENDTILGVALSEDQSELIVLLVEGSAVTASVYDRASRERRQYLVLEENVGEDYYGGLLSADGVILYTIEGYKYGSLLRGEDGSYKKGFTVDLLEGEHSFSKTEEEEHEATLTHVMMQNDPVIYYDGTRIVVCLIGDRNFYSFYRVCGMEIYVFTEGGLQYHGTWDNSLNDANYSGVSQDSQGYVFDGSKGVQPFYYDPVIVSGS